MSTYSLDVECPHCGAPRVIASAGETFYVLALVTHSLSFIVS